jgi:hypothetical protein
MKFTTSRLSEGNKLFPISILIDNLGITILRPSILGGNETVIPFSKIASVQVNFPFVGYSTITIFTVGEEEVKAHGFLKAEAQEIKNIILSKISS